jgi:hypothetical protein
MAYLSSTSSSPNVPTVFFQPVASVRTWVYTSTHDSSDIAEPNFFTDGERLGFEIRDFLYHYPSTGSTSDVTAHSVITVGATTTEVGLGSTVAGQAA